jgi:hypothetical protein
MILMVSIYSLAENMTMFVSRCARKVSFKQKQIFFLDRTETTETQTASHDFRFASRNQQIIFFSVCFDVSDPYRSKQIFYETNRNEKRKKKQKTLTIKLC